MQGCCKNTTPKDGVDRAAEFPYTTNMMKAQGTCPVCQGTTRTPSKGPDSKWYGGYDPETDTLPCSNCGAQYMYGKPRGTVPLRPDGTPCQHDYWRTPTRWRSVTNYRCAECGDNYQVDSGD